jgi:hypothetical protein
MIAYRHPISDEELDANRRLIAAAALRSPLILLLGSAAVEALATITASEPPVNPAPERRFLREVMSAIDALEIASSLGVAA